MNKNILDNLELLNIVEDWRLLRRFMVCYDFVGYESSVKQWCFILFFGIFFYIYDIGSVIMCGVGLVVSVCLDWIDLRFNYLQCLII